MARSGRETARKIKSRQATLYSSSGDEVSGKMEKRKERSKVSKQELSSTETLLTELWGSHKETSMKHFQKHSRQVIAEGDRISPPLVMRGPILEASSGDRSRALSEGFCRQVVRVHCQLPDGMEGEAERRGKRLMKPREKG